MELNYINLIRTRRSTRSYEAHPLTDADRLDINEAIASAVPLAREDLLEWQISDRSVMGCSGILYATSGTSVDELAEYGYQGQQIVLALLAQGWGTCWYGLLRLPGSPCSIALGRPGAPGLRTAVTTTLSRGYARRTFEQLVPDGVPEGSSPLIQTVLESARLAPSAMNRQPWSFRVASDRQVVLRGNAGRFPDLGICLANAMVTARQLTGAATVTRLDAGEYSVSW
ncbi:MAG: nitroreductase family protein [Candidatus Cryosericum sp.]